MKSPMTARSAAVLYALWGLAHLVGGAYQVLTLTDGGGSALTAMISSGLAVDPSLTVPAASSAFMGMGAANIAVVGFIVTCIAVLNWRNSREGYWMNLLLVGGVDLNLVVFLLTPGVMSWSDGLVGLVLFVPAAVLSTAARVGARARERVVYAEALAR